jgi:hypothetical protein
LGRSAAKVGNDAPAIISDDMMINARLFFILDSRY